MTDDEYSLSELGDLVNDASITFQVPEAALLQALGEASLHDAPDALEAAEMLKRHIAQIRQITDELSAWLFPFSEPVRIHPFPEPKEDE